MTRSRHRPTDAPFPPEPRELEASVVKDATGQSLAYDGCETRADADTARDLTMDETHQIASITELGQASICSRHASAMRVPPRRHCLWKNHQTFFR